MNLPSRSRIYHERTHWNIKPWGSPTVSLPFLILFDESQKIFFGDKAHSNVYKMVFSKLCGFQCLFNGGFWDSGLSDLLTVLLVWALCRQTVGYNEE
jgi:hypothetical protein